MTKDNTIAVDVDGTLHRDGIPNESIIAWLWKKKEEGFHLFLWSAQGKEHAEKAVELFELQGLFDVCLAKPGMIVDDMGWNWVRYTRAITDFSI